MNKKTQLLSTVVAVGSLLLLAGCAHYKAKPLQHLTTTTDSRNVTLSYKAFDKHECKKYLGKNVLRKKYQPVQLTITNPTEHTYTYSASSFSLPTVPAELVAKKVHFSVAGRAVGYGLVAATIFVPLTVIAATFSFCIIPTLLYIPATVGAAPFAAASIIDGVKASSANKELDIDFSTKAIQSEGVLRPGQTLNGLFFVPKKSFSNDFTFTLNGEKSGKTLVLHSMPQAVEVK